jgi:hypothetical protein
MTSEPEEDLRRVGIARTAQGQRTTSDDPDLATVVAAWLNLPESIRADILAMVKATWPKRLDI